MRKLTWMAAIVLLAGGLSAGFKTEHRPGTNSITNLYDAFGKDSTLQKDFGFSCLIRYEGKTILFDAGGNADIFKHNVRKLGVNLKSVDMVIVSHGHFDHLNGIDYVLKVNPKVKIYMPYDIFWGAPVPFDATGPEPGAGQELPEDQRYFDGGATKLTIHQSGRFWGANIEYLKATAEILPGLTLVATNSPYMGYFSGYPNKSFVEGQFEGDEHDHYKYTNLPELSLAMRTEKGQVLVTGCSHSGVERIVEAAKAATSDRINLVYGGFHLIPFDREKIEAIARYMKTELGVQRVAPAHCTGHLAFKVLKDLYASDFIFAGLGETISY